MKLWGFSRQRALLGLCRVATSFICYNQSALVKKLGTQLGRTTRVSANPRT